MTARGLAIVGLGMALAPHARALAELPDRYRIVGAWSRSAARRQDAAARFGLPVTADLDRLIDDPAVEVVLLLTPPDVHARLAQRCFAVGKHVVSEKPLDVDLSRAASMVGAAEARGLRLGCVLQHRFRTASRTLAGLLADGTLGRIEAASCTVPWWRDQAYYDVPGRGTRARDGGGVLMTQAIHTLDLFRSLGGGVRRVAALARTTALHRMECEDHVAAIMELAGGAAASFTATTAAYPGHAEQIRLLCTRGVATLDGAALRVDWLDGRRTVSADAGGTGAGSDPMAFAHEAHRALLADFADAVDAGREPLASGREALATQRLIAALLASAAKATWMETDGDDQEVRAP